MPNYSVLEAERTKELPANDKRGALIVYKLSLGVGDSRFPGVELLQKPETTAPAVGDTLDGQIEQTSYGPRFKKAQQMGGNQGGKAGGGSKFEADPKKLRAENRRSALHCAAGIAPEGTRSSDVLVVAQRFFDWIVADD